MTANRGIIAAGHPATAAAGIEALAAGGNAFDAIVAAAATACVAEPMLASLGGGGFLMARAADGEPRLLDFFVQTPRQRRTGDDEDFYPALADFGDATQEFHIGMGSIATPGTVAGLAEIQARLCRLPLSRLLAPAARLARNGVEITPVQAAIARVLTPILGATPESQALFASPAEPSRLATSGERVHNPQIAAALEQLGHDGGALLHAGLWGERLAADCGERGGHLALADLASYRVEERPPERLDYRETRVYINPPPSLGGLLIGVTLALLSEAPLGSCERRGAAHLTQLARAIELTQKLRSDLAGSEATSAQAEALVARARKSMRESLLFRHGTTQISAADHDGNLASLTLSNGEGSGYVLPGTGILLNNMLGEQDIHPGGLGTWPTDRRVGSMMCPTLVEHPDGSWTVTGSSGSNRIRSAIVQVLSNLIDFRLPLAEAVAAPRLHLEDDLLSLEPPMDPEPLDALRRHWPEINLFTAPSLFFGGAHSVRYSPSRDLEGAADARRGGVVLAC